MRQKKILFILKKRGNYGVSYGLLNSCDFIQDALATIGIESRVVQVVDNNDIDREVTLYQPTHVIIEALWVIPEKFQVLINLHPMVNWVVRLHSMVPFLGTEGIAFEWIEGYHNYPQLRLASNNMRMVTELELLGYELDYLPNVYDLTVAPPVVFKNSDIVNVGCFGAIRPFKNHLEQAIAAIIFANKNKKVLNFHINVSEFEDVGEPFLKNLRFLFTGLPHQLVEHPWSNHEEFLTLVRQMDLGLQVSFTETFNIVAADFVSNHIPLVGSSEIEWLSGPYKANPTDALDIAGKLDFAYTMRGLKMQYLNERNLRKFSKNSFKIWSNWI